MKTKLTKLAIVMLISIFGISSFAAALVVTPSTAFAATTDPCTNICDSSCKAPAQLKKDAGCSGTSKKLPSVVTNILNVVIGISGLVSAIYIVIGGINYMTSRGDPGKTEKAKKTILYALIGLIVCILAFAIVNFVIYNAAG